MYAGGLTKRMVAFADSLVGSVDASLAHVDVIACTFFAAVSGSSPATVAAIGANMIPEMEKRGYPKEYSTAVTAASGNDWCHDSTQHTFHHIWNILWSVGEGSFSCRNYSGGIVCHRIYADSLLFVQAKWL